MKIRNDLTTVVISRAPHRTLEGVMRVRSLDARIGGRGLVVHQQEPVAVVVRDGAGVRRATLRERPNVSFTAAFLAAPALYMIVRRMVKNGGNR